MPAKARRPGSATASPIIRTSDGSNNPTTALHTTKRLEKSSGGCSFVSAPKADQQAVPVQPRGFFGEARPWEWSCARGQAITTFAPGTTLPSADAARVAMPVPTVAGKTRCRMHGGAAASGAPKGKRNGEYRHGGFTTEAIDERRRLASLIRDSRDFLSRLR
jgi:hypothetical protein